MGYDKKTVQRRDYQSNAGAAGSKAIQKKSSVPVVQKAGAEEELQQHKSAAPIQKAEAPALDEEKPAGVTQHKTPEQNPASVIPAQRKENKTGMPDNLKAGIENLSGMDMGHVRVHYNSSQPAQLNALAYAQGSDIHVGPGQEKHLAHEAWHVVQQAQGRVKPTMQMKTGTPVNDDPGLEHEADVMGAKALSASTPVSQLKENDQSIKDKIVQRRVHDDSALGTEWNQKLETAATWEVNEDIAAYVNATELEWYDAGYNKRAAITTLVYKIKAKMTAKYEKEESDAADLDWADMKAYLDGLAADCLGKCITIEWLGDRGGHNSDMWKVKGVEIKDEVAGSIALDAHARGKGNKNLKPAQGAVKKAIQIYNSNVVHYISEV